MIVLVHPFTYPLYIYIYIYIYTIIITTALMQNVLTGFDLTFSLSVDDVGVVTSGRASSVETSSSKIRTIKCTPYECFTGFSIYYIVSRTFSCLKATIIYYFFPFFFITFAMKRNLS